MNARQMGNTVDSRIVKDDLPVMANLKVIRANDHDYGLTEDEIQDRNEFIRCHLLSEFVLLTMIYIAGSLEGHDHDEHATAH